MNKKILPIIGVIIVILLIIISSIVSKDEEDKVISTEDSNNIMANAQTESASISEKDKKDFINIDVDTYLAYLQNEEKKLVLLARPTCTYCQIADPILKKISKDYNINIYYLNTDEFKDNDQNNFVSSNELFQSGFGTPMLLLVGNNSIIDYVDGLTDTAHYLEFLRKNELIGG